MKEEKREGKIGEGMYLGVGFDCRLEAFDVCRVYHRRLLTRKKKKRKEEKRERKKLVTR